MFADVISRLLQFLGLVYALWFVLGVVTTRLTHRHRTYADDELLSPEQLPPAAGQHFHSLAPKLAAEGFTVSVYIKQSGAVALVDAYIAVWVHRERGQMANLYVIVPAIGSPKASAEFETISGISRDSVITNNNDRSVGVFAPVPWRHTVHLPWATDITELYEIHLFREKRLLQDNRRYLPPDEYLIEGSRNAAARYMRHQVRCGMMYETNVNGMFRATWKGAFILVFRIIPPLKQLRIWLTRRKTKMEYKDAISHLPVPPPRDLVITDKSPFEPPLTPNELTYQ